VAYANPSISISNPQFMCYAAPTYEKTGQRIKGEAALNAVGRSTLLTATGSKATFWDLRGARADAQE